MNRSRPATVVDVARVAGVSTATVSRVLNGEASVSAALVKRVQEAMGETKYVRNSYGRALRRQRSEVWAVIVSDLQNPFFTGIVTAIEQGAMDAGVSVMLCNSYESLQREAAYIEAAISQRMAGVVISVASEERSDLGRLEAAGVPTVIVDRRVHHFHGDSVLLDNEKAGELAADHLLDLGHRRVTVLAGPAGVNTTEDRVAGIGKAFTRRGFAFEQQVTVVGGLQASDAERLMGEYADVTDGPTAIIALNGPLTAGAFRGIKTADCELARDVSLIGFDDDHWTRMVSPAVTLIAQPVEEMGACAAQRLLARMKDHEVEPRHQWFPPRLMVRESTGPVPDVRDISA